MHKKSFLFTKHPNKRPIFLLLPLLFAAVASSAQSDSTRLLQKKLNEYSEVAQEKLFLHSDKNFYSVGEVLWFKAYLVDGFTHKPTEASKVGYVELLDAKNTPVLQGKISLEADNGEGSFYLPATLTSGNYKLRGYTNWMKNFGVDGFFEKQITIVNPFHPIDDKPVSHNSYQLDFFPEGGNLVNNLSNRLAFKVRDQFGRGLPGYGIILNEKNDTLLRFEPFKFGIGQFLLSPKPQEVYTAKFIFPDNSILEKPLPQSYNQGYVLSVNNVENNQIKITIQQSGFTGKQVYLLAHNQQVIKTAETLTLSQDSTSFFWDKSKLGDGIVQLTLFNSQLQPICERIVFNYPSNLLSINVSNSTHTYQSRTPVNFSLQTLDAEGNATAASLSLAAFPADSLQMTDQSTIVSFLWLSSNLKGKIESPEYYFSSRSTEVAHALDNLLLTHGWRRFRWDDVLAGKTEKIENDPELTGHIISGQVLHTQDNKSVENINTTLSIPDSTIKVFTNKSDKDGFIYFTVPDLYNSNNIIVRANANDFRTYRINILSPFSETYTNYQFPILYSSKINQDLILKYSISSQVQNLFVKDHLFRFTLPVSKTVPFYGKALKSYILDDYTRFSTMEDVLREYITEINVRKREGQSEIALIGLSEKQSMKLYPLVLIDGIPVVNQERLFSFNPLNVKKIDVAIGKYVSEDTTFNGIASFTTYKGNFDGQQVDANTLIQRYESLQSRREFYSPVYATETQKQSKVPDFRNVLLWHPTLRTSTNGKGQVSFYTSDRKGRYAVLLQGISADGKAGFTWYLFDVK